MSAIFGLLRFDGAEASLRDLRRMGQAMVHRGPDREKAVTVGPVGLGHRLLRITREDVFDHQPLEDPATGILLTTDGRLDNRDELATATGVAAADLPELPDSVLLLRAYLTWGVDCVRHLLGDFAFALWDPRRRRLVLGRDPMGQRYVHYHRGRRLFVFATEIGALWTHPDVPRALSEAAIGRRLIGARPGLEGLTSYEGIQGVPGATVLEVAPDGSIAERRYWEPHADPTHEHRDEAYYIEAYRDVLGEAVACRIRRARQAPGLLFSGGYDSAAIAALAGPVLAPTGRRLIAASSVMPADYRGTIRHARSWVEMCARDMPHLDVRYVTRDGRTFLTALEESFQEGAVPGAYDFVSSLLWASLAGEGVRVVMDGHGGDYTLHPRGKAALARLLVGLRVRRFLTELRGHKRLVGGSYASILWSALSMSIPRPLVLGWRRIRRGFAPVWRERPIRASFARHLLAEGIVAGGDLRANSHLGPRMRARMADTLRRVQAAPAPALGLKAARHGLELARPFHDRRVVELALAVPEDLYVKNGRNRYLACLALADLYPPEFQTRWRRNDDEIPDFQDMVRSIEPELLSELARLEASEELSRYVDFSKARALLFRGAAAPHASGWEEELLLSVSGWMTARYIEWFRRGNR